MKKDEKAIDLSAMADKWPSAIVSRNAVGKFTGGLISPATLKTNDEGLTRHRRHQRVFYKVDEFVAWLENGSHVVPRKSNKTAKELLEEKFIREREKGTAQA